MTNIAIIGLGEPNREEIPWGDPAWTFYGLPWDDEAYPYLDYGFDMHNYYLHTKPEAGLRRDYTERLNEFNGKLFLQETYPEVPNAIPYPLDAAIEAIGQDYFNSGPSYAMAYAIMQQPKRIGLWGMYMDKGTEWECQRPNMEYLIGVARGKGIEVFIPTDSPICKFDGEGIPLGTMFPEYIDRYGYL